MSLTRNNGAKVAKVSTQLKLNWTKADSSFSGFLSNTQKIKSLIETSFEASGLSRDFKVISEQQNVD